MVLHLSSLKSQYLQFYSLGQNIVTEMIETNSISHIKANSPTEQTHTPSQTYLSTRGGDHGVMLSINSKSQTSTNFSQLSFETVVLKGLAADGGLFLPEEIPQVPDWVCTFDNHKLAQNLSSKTFNVTLKSYPYRSMTNTKRYM